MRISQISGVEAFHDQDPGILPQAPVELAVADVDREHHPGPALEQAVGEAAGGGTDVESQAIGDVHGQLVESVVELDPAP